MSGFNFTEKVKWFIKIKRTNVLYGGSNENYTYSRLALRKILNGKQLLEDQAYILDMFVEKMKEEEPDISDSFGDLYDTTYPSKDAIMLLEQAIGKLNLELRTNNYY